MRKYENVRSKDFAINLTSNILRFSFNRLDGKISYLYKKNHQYYHQTNEHTEISSSNNF